MRGIDSYWYRFEFVDIVKFSGISGVDWGRSIRADTGSDSLIMLNLMVFRGGRNTRDVEDTPPQPGASPPPWRLSWFLSVLSVKDCLRLKRYIIFFRSSIRCYKQKRPLIDCLPLRKKARIDAGVVRNIFWSFHKPFQHRRRSDVVQIKLSSSNVILCCLKYFKCEFK